MRSHDLFDDQIPISNKITSYYIMTQAEPHPQPPTYATHQVAMETLWPLLTKNSITPPSGVHKKDAL